MICEVSQDHVALAINHKIVWSVEACLAQWDVVYKISGSGCFEIAGRTRARKRPHAPIHEDYANSIFVSRRDEDVVSAVDGYAKRCEEKRRGWSVTVNRAATIEANRPTAGNRRDTAPTAVTPHFSHASPISFGDDDVAEEVLSYTEWVAEAGRQRIRIVLRGAIQIADTPRAGERGHGLVGVDHSNTMVAMAADDDELLSFFDDGSDAIRIKELRFEPVGVVGVASCPAASKSTHRPVAQNGANAVIVQVAQQHVAFAVSADASGKMESGSERVIAVHASNISVSSQGADGAVVMNDTQTEL